MWERTRAAYTEWRKAQDLLKEEETDEWLGNVLPRNFPFVSPVKVGQKKKKKRKRKGQKKRKRRADGFFLHMKKRKKKKDDSREKKTCKNLLLLRLSSDWRSF